jgi:hypothetical protein
MGLIGLRRERGGGGDVWIYFIIINYLLQSVPHGKLSFHQRGVS